MNPPDRLFLDAMPDAVVVVDARGRVVLANTRCEALLGWPPAELVGHPVEVLVPARFVGHVAKRERYTRAPGVRSMGGDRELVALHRSGEEVPVDISLAPILLGGEPHVLAAVRDARPQRALLERVRQQAEEVEELHRRLQEQAVRDPLTGLFNRRYLDETLPREIAVAARGGTPLALAVLDLDHFKRVNDTWGHAAGDRVLAALGQVLRAGTRAGDLACRYGGEEFVVVLVGAALADAVRRAESWRQALEALPPEDAMVPVTASVGVAAWRPGESAADLFARADAALYRAKAAGRDRVAAG